MRLGLIGSTGRWQTYAPALEHVAGLTLVAVAPTGPEETMGAFDHASGLTVDPPRSPVRLCDTPYRRGFHRSFRLSSPWIKKRATREVARQSGLVATSVLDRAALPTAPALHPAPVPATLLSRPGRRERIETREWMIPTECGKPR